MTQCIYDRYSTHFLSISGTFENRKHVEMGFSIVPHDQHSFNLCAGCFGKNFYAANSQNNVILMKK